MSVVSTETNEHTCCSYCKPGDDSQFKTSALVVCGEADCISVSFAHSGTTFGLVFVVDMSSQFLLPVITGSVDTKLLEISIVPELDALSAKPGRREAT